MFVFISVYLPVCFTQQSAAETLCSSFYSIFAKQSQQYTQFCSGFVRLVLVSLAMSGQDGCHEAFGGARAHDEVIMATFCLPANAGKSWLAPLGFPTVELRLLRMTSSAGALE